MWEDSQKGFGCGNDSSAEKKAQGGVQKKRLKGECRKKRLKGECRKGIRLNPGGETQASPGSPRVQGGHRGCYGPLWVATQGMTQGRGGPRGSKVRTLV
jgi:hypothetical protein